MTWDTISPYNRGFREFTAAYEAFGFEEIHADALPFLTTTPGLVLDVGSGSGRDAAWFASHGWEVIAAEPAKALREEAGRLHADARIRWVDDPAFRQQMITQGTEPIGDSPAEFDEYWTRELAKWGEVIRSRGIRAAG